jgi:hypothetical protein
MKITKVQLLIGLVLIEACIIAMLLITRFPAGYGIKFVAQYSDPVQNPLKLALEYEASEKKFEELVRKYPEWISYRTNYKGMRNWPILADCAILNRTSYVGILIAHNADVVTAIACLEEVDARESVELLKRVRDELNVSTNTPRISQ